jgi:hypothetical protein
VGTTRFWAKMIAPTIGFLIVVGLVGTAISGRSSGPHHVTPNSGTTAVPAPTTTTAKQPEQKDRSLDAFNSCKDFVKRRLKSPSSATFRNYFQHDGEVVVTGVGDGPYVVRSSVDSENSFGAKLRSDFVCTVTYAGDDNWRLAGLTLDQP